jgi:hypothetical protein
MQPFGSTIYVAFSKVWVSRSVSTAANHLFRKDGVAAKINLQKDGGQAKPYQVKQVRAIILEAHLQFKLGDE